MTAELTIRLNKHLALQLGVSRREADELIEQGKVVVAGQTAVLGQQISVGDIVTVDGKQISADTEKLTVLFHKPIGYVCSRKAQGDAPTIYDLLPPELHSLKPVGRLDKNSSGLLLLSNDGDFSHQMTHPSFKKTKVYEVQLDAPLQPLHQQMISDFGVILEDGKSKFAIAKTDEGYEITMSEGRNRQIRRTFAALGYTVTKLHRVKFGNYALNEQPEGNYRLV